MNKAICRCGLFVVVGVLVLLLVMTDKGYAVTYWVTPPTSIDGYIVVGDATAPDSITVCAGNEVECSATATDTDWRYPCWFTWIPPTELSDTFIGENAFTWSKTGGEWKDGNKTSSVTWIAPNTAGTYDINCTMNDDAIRPYGEGGNRNDPDFTPPQSVTVKVIGNVTITSPTELQKVCFNNSSPTGFVDIICTATADPSECTDDITWSCGEMPDGTTASWPNGQTGGSVILRLTGLPAHNTGFGVNSVTATCHCKSDTHNYKLFYLADETNHPGAGAGTVQNWYYYYKETSANGGTTTYYNSDGLCHEKYFCGAWTAFITKSGHHESTCSTWGYPIYIDRFAWASRHECKHVALDSAMWGATTDRNNADDADIDFIKDIQEPTYHRGYDPTKKCTWPDEVGYGTDPIPDYEDDCMRATSSPYGLDPLWTNGSANGEDWANPGKQY